MSGIISGIVVTLLCVDGEPQRFGRRLAATVNPGPMHLARIVSTGTQIYPVRDDALGEPTMLRCEFRMRNAAAEVTDEEARRLLERIDDFNVIKAHFI
ncbi:MAG: hypothetical protein ACO3SP_06765, partial [Ilumatobacteraceae bacterium]